MIGIWLRGLAHSRTGRDMLAGALGGLVLTSMFLQAHGASLNRYSLERGKPGVGYAIVWLLALVIGALFGRFAGSRAGGDLGYALAWGLLLGLGWFVAASCLVLPILRGVHPFSFTPSVGGEVTMYLVYGMLLGVGYFQIGELLHQSRPVQQRQSAPREETSARTHPTAHTQPPASAPVRVRRTTTVPQPRASSAKQPNQSRPRR
jgi:hypothetical protein